MFARKLLIFICFLFLMGCATHDSNLKSAKNKGVLHALDQELDLTYVHHFDFEKYYQLNDKEGYYLADLGLSEELFSSVSSGQKESDRYIFILVNREHPLPASFIPPGLVQAKIPFSNSSPNDRTKLHKEAAQAAEQLFAQAQKESVELIGVSGYRSFDRQQEIFNQYCNQYGEFEASKFSAPAGMSEHQTGLALDVSSKKLKNDLADWFGQTHEGKWLHANCARYGFIIRYPKNKEHITGYQYEPWHLRYVGKELALALHLLGLTLEEYAALHKKS